MWQMAPGVALYFEWYLPLGGIVCDAGVCWARVATGWLADGLSASRFARSTQVFERQFSMLGRWVIACLIGGSFGWSRLYVFQNIVPNRNRGVPRSLAGRLTG